MAKRFRLQDLRGPGQRGPAGRAVDGFVNVNTQAPNFAASQPDFGPLAAGIVKNLRSQGEKDKKDREEDGEQLARNNAEDLAVLSEALEKAIEGLTDPDEIADASSGVIRSLAEAGKLSPQANPRWLIGVARADTQRELNALAVRMEGQIDGLSVLTDENGKLAESPDALAALQEEFNSVLDNPLVRVSQTARELVDQFRTEFEPKFLGAVTRARMTKQEQRADEETGRQLAQGFPNPTGGDFVGFGALADVLTDPELAIPSIVAGKEHLRNQEGVTNIDRKFMAQLEDYVDTNVADNPQGVKRLLDRIGEMELTPGLAIENDTREFVNVIHGLRQRAEAAEDTEARSEAAARQVAKTDISSTYLGQFAINMEANPNATLEQLRDMTDQSMLTNEIYLSILDGAGLNELPVDIKGDLLVKSKSMAVEGFKDSRATDAIVMTQIRRLERAGEPSSVIQSLEAQLSPSGLLQRQDDDGAAVWKKLQDSSSFERIGRAISKDSTSENLSTAGMRSITNKKLQAEEMIQNIAVDLSRAGKDPQEALNDPRVVDILKRIQAETDAADAAVADNRNEFIIAASQGDSERMDRALEVMKTIADPKTYSDTLLLRQNVVKRVDNILLSDPVFAVNQRTLQGDIITAAEAAELDPSVAAELAKEVDSQFFIAMRSRINNEISRLPVAQQPAARARAIAEERQKAIETVLPQALQDSLKTAKEKGVEFESKRLTGENDFKRFEVAQSLRASLVGVLDIPDALENPETTIGFFEFNSPTKRFVRGLEEIGVETAAKFIQANPIAREKVLTDWASQAALGAAFSPDDILSGKGTLTFSPRSPQIQRRIGFSSRGVFQDLERGGFTVTKQTAEGTATVSREVDLKDIHPTLSLFFKKPTELKAWRDTTPDETRKKFYNKLGLRTDNLDKTDEKFIKRQATLLLRYHPR